MLRWASPERRGSPLHLGGPANLACGRSSRSYPAMPAADRGLTLHFTASQGATTGMVIAGQLRPLSASTDLVTIQVGGNDSGISPAVTTCMGPFNRPACLTATGSVEVFGRTVLPALLDGVYDRVRRKAPDVRILVDYVDPLAAFERHGTCSSRPWMLRLEATNPMRSFHPDREGNDAYLALVEVAIH